MVRKKSGKRMENGSPHGRDEVINAILDATAELLLKKGPTELSIREIAELANVKHPQIYRHFGSKDKLIMAVHARKIGDLMNTVSKIESLDGNLRRLYELYTENRWRQIALARAMIDGVDPRLIQNQFPVIDQFIKLLKKDREHRGTEWHYEPEEIAAALGALVMGWLLFKPFLAAATNLDHLSEDKLDDLIIGINEDLLSHLTKSRS